VTAADVVPSWAGVVERLDPISLRSLLEVADLQERYDTKYVVPVELLAPVVERLGAGVHVLDIDGRRATDYRTTYFDTPDLATYRAHVQRRRRRYKLRTRVYGPELTTLEVKVKDKGGRTIKHRRDHPGSCPERLPQEALDFIADRLFESYGFAVPAGLAVGAVTTYARTTLVDPHAGERITVDANLRAHLGEHAVTFDPGYVLVEVKSPERTGRTDRILRQFGVRPARVSKYGIGVAVLRPELPSNLWRPALRKLDPAR
jgi:hypothetical protein